MEMIPGMWSFKRPNALLPIIEGVGTCENTLGETALLMGAVGAIEKAKKFNGRAISEQPTEERKNAVTVSFKVIFPTENELNQFMESLQKTGFAP